MEKIITDLKNNVNRLEKIVEQNTEQINNLTTLFERIIGMQ